jgi:penicillin-insensitive murein DD-endopeptidase
VQVVVPSEPAVHNGAFMRLTLVVSALLVASVALASDNPWPSFKEPAEGAARSIGDYSAGCLQGAVRLPLDGLGYQVMRPSRRRYFGHPALVEYIRTFGKRVREQQFGVLLIGDMSQPRGGRAASGHASHQTGLDVDIWYTHPERARKVPLSATEREQLSASSVLDKRGEGLAPRWRKHVENILRLAVDEARVDRLFVHPAIKRSLCESSEPRAWLRKVRPWHGHDDHFHVRLGCLDADVDCKSQPALPEGDGCDKLAWWFNKAAQEERQQARKDYQKTVDEGRGWPEQCEPVLAAPGPPREAP